MHISFLETHLKSLDLKYPPLFKKDEHIKYVKDWRGQYIGETVAVLRPFNTNEVSHILKFANFAHMLLDI